MKTNYAVINLTRFRIKPASTAPEAEAPSCASGVTRPFGGANVQGLFPGVAAFFFALPLTLGRKVEICGHDDLFFFNSSLDFG